MCNHVIGHMTSHDQQLTLALDHLRMLKGIHHKFFEQLYLTVQATNVRQQRPPGLGDSNTLNARLVMYSLI